MSKFKNLTARLLTTFFIFSLTSINVQATSTQPNKENIKNEIVDIAFLMAEKIVDHEIDKKANQELINQTLSKLEKED